MQQVSSPSVNTVTDANLNPKYDKIYFILICIQERISIIKLKQLPN